MWPHLVEFLLDPIRAVVMPDVVVFVLRSDEYSFESNAYDPPSLNTKSPRYQGGDVHVPSFSRVNTVNTDPLIVLIEKYMKRKSQPELITRNTKVLTSFRE